MGSEVPGDRGVAMGSRVRWAVFLWLAAVPCGAAEVVVPGRYASVEAPSYTLIPFGRMGSVRLQQLYEGFLFPAGTMQLVGLAVRPDKDGSAPAKSDVDLELLLGAGGPGLSALSARFADNRPPGMTAVFQRRKVSLPAQSPGSGPMPFAIQFALDAPFPYAAVSGPLLLEMVIHDQPGSGHSCDAPYLSASLRSDFGPPGCSGSAAQVPAAACRTASVQWGEKVHLEIQRLLPGAPAVLGLGLAPGGTWAGLTLPFDLAPLGAPGCPVSLPYLHLESGQADQQGTALFAFSLPAVPHFVGRWICFQGLGLDPAANPLGLVLSAGHQVQVAGPDAVGRVYNFDLGAAEGLAQVGLAHVVKFLTP